MRVSPSIPRFVLVAVVAVAASSANGAVTPTRESYARGVSAICGGALLFEGRHPIGTRAGAVAVAADIRASTQRRLSRVAAIPVPRALAPTAARWRSLERRLADTYAESYVRIYETIASVKDADRLAIALTRLLHAPDAQRRIAERLEARLGVPDCVVANAR